LILPSIEGIDEHERDPRQVGRKKGVLRAACLVPLVGPVFADLAR
jgi:hypothetical protein